MDQSLGDVAGSFTTAASILPKTLQSLLMNEGRYLRDAFAAGTPIKTGRLKRSWRVRSDNAAHIAGVEVFNPIFYAPFLEFGVGKNDETHVWSKAMKGKTETRKLTLKKGRIWSKSAVYGMMLPNMAKAYPTQLASRVLKVAVGTIK